MTIDDTVDITKQQKAIQQASGCEESNDSEDDIGISENRLWQPQKRKFALFLLINYLFIFAFAPRWIGHIPGSVLQRRYPAPAFSHLPFWGEAFFLGLSSKHGFGVGLSVFRRNVMLTKR
jgi:hypothetical protein